MPILHDQKVASIAAAVREHVTMRPGERAHVHKGGPRHVVPLPNDRRFQTTPIDVSSLNQVLAIDPNGHTCTAEPGVSFANLISQTLRFGLIPTVVPELEGITIGGAVAGCSVESMSYRYGGFHDSCLEYELIDGTGSARTLSPKRSPELFHMLHGSYGTLGILTRLTFKLVPAMPFVRMEYRKLATLEDFEAEMLRLCESDEFSFIDGIIHGPNQFVLCLGNFVEKAPYTSNYRWLNIYYRSTLNRREDYLTTKDYCFRYDTECHWITKSIPPLEWKPVRLLVGKMLLGSTNLIRWSGRLERLLSLKKRPDVVCDIFVPSRRFTEFFRWYEKEFQFYPLWIVPYRIPEMYPWVAAEHAARMKETLFMDCAVYGMPNNKPSIDYSELLERKTHELDGIKTLISRNHYTEESFWKVYNQENYEAAKKKLDPNGLFPGIFEKLHRV